MRRFVRIIQLIPLAFFCAFFLYAAATVQRDRVEAASKPQRPNLIGEARAEPAFLQATFRQMNQMWTDFYIAFLPGLVPGPMAQSRGDQSGLDALKTRTRNEALGLEPTGLPKINF